MKRAPAYVIISLVFLIIIGVGFAYSCFFYPNAHPLDCMVRAYTGKDCPTCGFSRSFSYYSHLEFDLGRNFNKLSWPVFLFFAGQFFLRLSVLTYYFSGVKKFNNTFVVGDIIISISTFLLAFLPIILKF
ncbi:MAG: DUF2752 domain-containing protein [Bacteroidota bacterium]